METQFQKLTIRPKIQYPRRPGVGTLGRKVLVRANYVKLTKVFFKQILFIDHIV